MRWFFTRWLPVALLGLLLSYIGALSIFAYQANSAIQEAKRIYDSIQSEGFSDQSRKDLEEFVPTAMGLRNTADGPLVKPYISLSGYGQEVDSAFEIFDYIAPAIPGLAEVYFSEKKKRYFIGFQNPAEARGTGGLVGAFAIIKVGLGEFSIERVGSNYLLELQNEIPVKLPDEFRQTYGNHPAWWPNSNMSPHFPYAAKIWLGLWKNQEGEVLDGALALDPFVLRDILRVTGPVNVREVTLDEKNVVDETLFASYLRLADDNEGRKSYLIEIIESVIGRATLGDVNRWRLLLSLRDSVVSNRIRIYSANKEVQRILSQSQVSGALRTKDSNEYRLVLQNLAGNKMDYFINRDLRLETLRCGNQRVTKAIFKISNVSSANLDLPDNYYGRQDRENFINVDNSTKLGVFLYGPPGAKLIRAIDLETGLAVGYPTSERKRIAAFISLELVAGESREFQVVFKGGSGPLSTVVQPLVSDQKTKVLDKCER